MKDFLLSENFLWSAICLVVVVGIIAILWRNTVWEARGITPAEDVERLRTRIAGLLPKSLFARWILAGVIVLIALGLWWGLSSTSGGTTSTSSSTLAEFLSAPSPKTVWEFFKNYWMWMIFILAVLFFASNALPEVWAKGVKGMVTVVAVVLVGAMIVHGIWGESSSSQQVRQVSPTDGCTSVNPCAPIVGVSVHVPQGKSVCFEPFFWSNTKRLGVRTSYKGGAESGYESIADSFRFVPEAGVTPPKYWFVQEGSSTC